MSKPYWRDGLTLWTARCLVGICVTAVALSLQGCSEDEEKVSPSQDCEGNADCNPDEMCWKTECKAFGMYCNTDADCDADKTCWNELCEVDGEACDSDPDCPEGQVCLRKMCKASGTSDGQSPADPNAVPTETSTTTVGTTTTYTTTTTTTRAPVTLQLTQETATNSRFLIQSTFGPTKFGLDDLSRTDYPGWIRDQMALPVGSHRAYFRERSNPRNPTGMEDYEVAGTPRSPCTRGSRWTNFAFTQADYGKPVSVAGGEVKVSGVLRTEADPSYAGNALPDVSQAACSDVQPRNWERKEWECAGVEQLRKLKWNCDQGDQNWVSQKYCQQSCFSAGYGYPGDDCSVGWPNLQFNGYVCWVEEEVGGRVFLKTDSECDSDEAVVMLNPAIWFAASAGAGPTQWPQLVAAWPGVLFLYKDWVACTLTGEFLRSDVEAEGRTYRLDSRLQTEENTFENPAASLAEACPIAPVTFLNDQHCTLQPGCLAMSLDHVKLTLNADTFQKFLDIDRRYVYVVTGLRPTEPPCGHLSRWLKLDCSTDDCDSPASLDTADADAVAAALQVEEGGRGWLRDVDIDCVDVDAGVTVQVGQDFFRHVHLNEYNVYDFSEWANTHPGGRAHIQKWSTEGFELKFPASHNMARWEAGSAREVVGSEFVGVFQDVVDFQALPQSLQSIQLAQAFHEGDAASGLVRSCGSPGEVANDPAKGHRFPAYVVREPSPHPSLFDPAIDGRGAADMVKRGTSWSKAAVWMAKALHGEDQLRQRAAWALSQIFVVGADDFNEYTELWVNYYDIFVRNAFGNFRDVLREVTYSPLMGEYLTYKRNRAFDNGNTYPDENYAREVMQLFTIGLWKLEADGTKMKDDSDNDIPTYSNEHIMNFARVFTGFDEQAPRTNVEKLINNRNMIDPMRMNQLWHDTYPKPDLDGGFLGDGYPLCSDIPVRAFLKQGAKYAFLGTMQSDDDTQVLVAESSSALYSALCGSGSPDNCDFALDVTLPADVACSGQECKLDSVDIVKVGNGYFQHLPPACVYLFFYEGQTSAEAGRRYNWKRTCADPAAAAAGIHCCDGDQHERVCGHAGSRVRFSEAERACADLGLTVCAERLMDATACDVDQGNVWTKEACTVKVGVASDGKVASLLDATTKQNLFSVTWTDTGYPMIGPGVCPNGCIPTTAADGCECEAVVEMRAVFSEVPSASDLRARLRIGALPRTSACGAGGCSDGVVRAHPSGAVDQDTVFELDGRFFRNVESTVHIGAHFEFRNPPNFMQKYLPSARVALQEVEALLDHLFLHPNTPVFVAKRLAQRFTTSNPSPDYVRVVAEAFRTGSFNGEVYGGVYGDLGATVAALLLHPEARDQSQNADGALREPLLKVVQLLRSLEYDGEGFGLATQDLVETIGEYPYQSPSVFNFYHAEFQPDSFAGSNVAPEFEIFTTPAAISLTNSLIAIVDNGLTACNGGIGVHNAHRDCKVGQLAWTSRDDLDASLTELDILLTGGRMTSKEVARESYEQAEAANAAEQNAAKHLDPMAEAQKAILMSPAFHTMGDPKASGERTVAEPPEASPSRSYRATVMVFLMGGADTFNMLVPLDCPLYEEYQEVRGEVALLPEQLHKIETDGQTCSTFGVHQSLSIVKELYDEGSAAFASNIGALVEPLTKDDLKGNSQKCAGLFSHSDQQQAAQTLKCQIPGASPKGAGGRIADAVASGSQGWQTHSFSVAGSATWPKGFNTQSEIIDQRHGAITLEQSDRLHVVAQNVTESSHDNIYCEEYARSFASAIEDSETLDTMLNSAGLSTDYQDGNSGRLGPQLKQAARLIAAREERKAERDFFFVALGGFDTHKSVGTALAARFSELNNALKSFVAELKAQGVYDDTVIVTHSDFGRTLTANSGEGTDHAWAGNHIVLGGAVQGGKVFNDFPASLLEDSDQDAGRGRLIPKYPWENIMVPIAEWMGVEDGQMSEVFPNLGNFDANTHFISKDSLFKP